MRRMIMTMIIIDNAKYIVYENLILTTKTDA